MRTLLHTPLSGSIEMDPGHTDARFYLGLIQRGMPGEVQRGSDNIKTAARMGNKEARGYLHAHLMGWY